ncbi:unnamed protein product [Paramecium pentaurelia]|uniref:Uncharacterized protein n=1 Tax=Paramecium pentaurelia TaxID=43138 RepID=A0A8S1VUT3_9CILI|nr:unnamed protein product [Paramecium pentaurelia]
MNQNDISLKDEILNKLQNSSINPVLLKDLIDMINVIFQYKQQYQEFQFQEKNIMLEERLEQLSTDLTSLIELIKAQSRISVFFKMQNSDIQNAQQAIRQVILTLHSDVNNFFESFQFITLSAYTKSKLVINLDLITFNTTIKLYHPKVIPIKSNMNLILKQGFHDEIFELAVLKKDLLMKIKEKAVQKLDKIQEKYLEKNATHVQAFIKEYSKSTQITTFFSENHPYVITTENQNRIYLCKGMKLVFFPNQTLIVLETNTKNQNLKHFSTVLQEDNQNKTNCINIPGYGYISFLHKEINQVFQKGFQQSIKDMPDGILSEGTTSTFFLNKSHISMSSNFPLINATLYHDNNGFYMLPIKTKMQNYYYLYYDKQIQTKSDKYIIGLQIKGKGWIQITAEKEKVDGYDM